MAARQRAFQTLKPPCVALSEAALALSGRQGPVQAVTDCLDALKRTLSSLVAEPDPLDVKLSDYAFFPISSVLKASQRVSIRCLELAIQCIELLIRHGWRQQLQPQLAAQLVILCTLLAERKPKGLAFSESTEELMTSSFGCLSAVFAILGKSQDCYSELTSDTSFPQLGQTISVALEALGVGASADTQVAATNALETLVQNIREPALHASFLPGITSKLSRALTPTTSTRRDHRVLAGCLNILTVLISSTMRDGPTKSSGSTPALPSGGPAHLTRPSVPQQPRQIIDSKWRETAAAQLKVALGSVFKLRSHDREDVQAALGVLCLTVLRDCSISLANCCEMVLETLVSVCAQQPELSVSLGLASLVSSRPALEKSLQAILYDWLQALPTVMQSSDEQAKVTKMQQINVAYDLLDGGETDMDAIERAAATSLRDSVIVTIAGSNGDKRPLALSEAPAMQSLGIAEIREEKSSNIFSSPLITMKGQEASMCEIERFARRLSSRRTTAFIDELRRSFHTSHNLARTADYWLLLTTVEESFKSSQQLDALLNFDEDVQTRHHEYLEELYASALTILSSDDESNVQPRALALRTVALRAQSAREDFRYELVDALYPVLHSLATPNVMLQRDSITALNITASACGYTSVQDLIVGNVDYLVNAVALKLNAFDVSPQAPQVLLMMLRLAGPSLLPFLEDTVESIFAALEDYHGYPLLVELLFQVLGVMAEEGVQTTQLAITDISKGVTIAIEPERWRPTTITGLASLLGDMLAERPPVVAEGDTLTESHPRRPWKNIDHAEPSEEIGLDESEEDGAAEGPEAGAQEDSRAQAIEDAEPEPPAPKTYRLLLKITELTQHFLPAASPSLRNSLLALIRTTAPALAKHENSFLPLVNTLWPEVVSRLDDPEPHIVATALDIVGVLCESAGDFMRTRVTQLWPRLVELYERASQDILQLKQARPSDRTRPAKDSAMVLRGKALRHAVQQMHERPADYVDTSSRQLWSALTGVLTAIVEHVALSPELFDEALDMLMPILHQSDVRAALGRENGDAVWLTEMRTGGVGRPRQPEVPDGATWAFAVMV